MIDPGYSKTAYLVLDSIYQLYLASVEFLKKEKVDVFIGNHTWNNDTYGKSLKLLNGENNAFIDDKIWDAFLEHCEKQLADVIAEDP
mgnify:CR=1 FL=1